MTIRYISTRGTAPTLSFEEVTLAGLATDGGLYVPDALPQFSAADIASMRGLTYTLLAERILSPFTEGTLTQAELRVLITRAYSTFSHADVAPVKHLGGKHYLLELFHGPTLAFKDFALQFLGQLLDHILTRRGEHAVVVGATSGDTGSAAIAGCRGQKHLDIFIMHPEGRTSDVQRRQMTTVKDANVHNIAVKGTFDDCQDIVKALFADQPFRTKHHLVAVNSINWVRILVQVVYYFHAALSLGAPEKRVSFCVPTGNFGDIYAGYIAKRMGLPVDRLIIASNTNDILTRCLNTGAYSMNGVVPTLSPSMDIQVSSNFERLLFDLHGRGGARIAQMMKDFRERGSITLAQDAITSLRAQFDAHATDDAGTKRIIAEAHKSTGELLDPHTAVGYAAALACEGKTDTPIITLATAHPAKFPDAVKEATGITPPLPAHMANLFSLPERYDIMENGADAVKRYIEERV